MRILIIGTGSIGQRHIRNLQALVNRPEFILLREGARQDTFSQSLNAKVVDSFETAIALEPQLAVIATPSTMHWLALQSLLPAAIPCYVEKPVVTSDQQVDALTALLERLPAVPPTVTGCNLRYLPSVQRLAGLIRDGTIGRPVRANIQVGQWLPDWRPTQDYRSSYSADPAWGGGVVLDLIHELDITRYLFGEFEQVHAVGGHYSQLEIAVEDSVAILLGRSAGPAVAIGLDYVARKLVRRYEIIGDEGSLLWDLPSRRLELMGVGATECIDCGEYGFDTTQSYIAAMADLLDSIKTARPSKQDIFDGLRSARLALTVKRQLQ